ncbi:unnamed protein product [marine sediment metagenome]|uniref:Uncharacterized protein n=1 Tax=marine sediment metagenome TaxID=412755 RepID=X0ZCP6_9ZZZZ
MIAGELIGYFGDSITLDDLFERWIIGQDSHAQMTSADTNPILQYLSSLMVEFKRGHDFTEDYEVKGAIGVIGKTCLLTGTAANFFATFTKLAKKKGLPMEYKSAGVLAKRFKDSQKILNEAGWSFEESQLRSRVVEYTFKYSPEKSGEAGETENAPSPPLSPKIRLNTVSS